MKSIPELAAAIAVYRAVSFMRDREENLPLCARIFRWVLYLSLAGLSLLVITLAGGYVAHCFADCGFL